MPYRGIVEHNFGEISVVIYLETIHREVAAVETLKISISRAHFALMSTLVVHQGVGKDLHPFTN
jgi:hypothetical protein